MNGVNRNASLGEGAIVHLYSPLLLKDTCFGILIGKYQAFGILMEKMKNIAPPLDLEKHILPYRFSYIDAPGVELSKC